ncbi:MAG: glycosyltransferase family 2 protein [Candidatus Hydrogenedentes bacterium]|nr:glycosyltransferase family 2 protein [Candidatus Hydrogenedentota bacterium]
MVALALLMTWRSQLSYNPQSLPVKESLVKEGRCTISVVSPVHNERENIRPFLMEVKRHLDALRLEAAYEIIFVNDGSGDGSGVALDTCADEFPDIVTVVHLARNFGMEPAIHAGLDLACGDAVIIMDADMQDDPAAFATFVEKWRGGYEVVYAVRSSRQEGPVRRALFWSFYRILGWIANIPLPADASNFALMDRHVVDTLRTMPERNRYLRGLRAWVGFRQTGVPVARRARYDKKTRLGFRGQWKLAMNAIFAFSYVPIFVFRIAGALTLLFSLGLILWALYYKLIAGLELRAWASILIATSFIGGINLFGLGVIGEYVARIHDEVKGRPIYIVRRMAGKRGARDG